jgi:hypothetical protein
MCHVRLHCVEGWQHVAVGIVGFCAPGQELNLGDSLCGPDDKCYNCTNRLNFFDFWRNWVFHCISAHFVWG